MVRQISIIVSLSNTRVLYSEQNPCESVAVTKDEQ